MINKTELKDVVLRFQSKTDISIKDIFGEAPSKEQEKMWVKFLKEYFKIEKEFLFYFKILLQELYPHFFLLLARRFAKYIFNGNVSFRLKSEHYIF